MPVTYNSIMIKKVLLYLLKPKVLSRKARFINLSEFALHTDHWCGGILGGRDVQVGIM